MDNYYVATFYSTSQALRFEKTVLKQELAVRMIPVPRVISSSCGLAARIEDAVWPAIAQLLSSEAANAEEVYLFTQLGKTTQAERIWVDERN
ncbi:MAG TPA: DUF3343 domain-containing protein [Oscillospiraceae bacterium]|nr:DUF3343 domain-containing protein [Oscillospiraceae bacterium]